MPDCSTLFQNIPELQWKTGGQVVAKGNYNPVYCAHRIVVVWWEKWESPTGLLHLHSHSPHLAWGLSVYYTMLLRHFKAFMNDTLTRRNVTRKLLKKLSVGVIVNERCIQSCLWVMNVSGALFVTFSDGMLEVLVHWMVGGVSEHALVSSGGMLERCGGRCCRNSSGELYSANFAH